MSTAVAAGCIGVAGFGPLGYFWAALLSMVILIWLWRDMSPRHAAWTGFAYGVGLFGAGVSWVYVSIHIYGQMPPWMAVIVVTGFVMILSLYPALVGWIHGAVLVRVGTAGRVLALSAVWSLMEWFRSWFLSGFPWLSFGYSQVDSWLAGWAPVVGVYGVSWLVTLTAALAVAALRPGTGRWYALTLVAVVWIGGLVLMQVRWAETAGEPLDVALVQGNVSLDQKWSTDRRPSVMNRYLNLTNHLEDRDLVVWPESALPYFIHEVDDRIWRSMQRHPADFVLGLLEQRTDGRSVRTFNSVVAITGGDPQIYRKAHLVPFGEYLPFEWLFGWVIDYLRIPMSDFDAWEGPDQGPLSAGNVKIGVTICYEDVFPEQLMTSLPGAVLLVNVSEDAWFGDSLAPHQRIQMARMRSIETARPMLRAANTGVSAIIDHRGTVTAASEQFTSTVVKGSVQPMSGTTPYVRWGNGGIVVVMILLLIVAGSIGVRARPGPGPDTDG